VSLRAFTEDGEGRDGQTDTDNAQLAFLAEAMGPKVTIEHVHPCEHSHEADSAERTSSSFDMTVWTDQ